MTSFSHELPSLLTKQEAADALKVCPGTIANLMNRGTLPRIKIGAQVRIPVDAVLALLKPQHREAA